MRIAMVGTRGVPATYGGFETAVEEIGSRLADQGHAVDVYCRNLGQQTTRYRGMRLINLPALRRSQFETLSHTALSVGHCVLRSRPDHVFLFNVANAPLARVLRAAGIPYSIHIDGLEWRRSKWAGLGSRYFRRAEAMAAADPGTIIADGRAIAEYVQSRYDRDSAMISYGALEVVSDPQRLPELGLRAREYHLVVARFEPENNVLEIVQAYVASNAALPLVVVGDAPYGSAYVAAVTQAAAGDPRVRLVGSIWDQALLDSLYGNAASYVHGHSVGGTNPSLLRAIGAGAPVIAQDNPFNREVACEHGLYFGDEASLQAGLASCEDHPGDARDRAALASASVLTRYNWDDVAAQYLALALGHPVEEVDSADTRGCRARGAHS